MVKDYADRLYGYDPSDRLFEVTKHYLKHEMERGCKKTDSGRYGCTIFVTATPAC